MPPEATDPVAPTPAVAVNPAPAAPTPVPVVPEGKTFDQAEVDRIVQSRLARAEKDVEARIEATRVEAEERAKMDETQKYKADLEKSTAKTAELEARATAAERKAELIGKVADVNLALKIAEAKHFNDDGSLNSDALFTDYPILKPAAETTPVITPKPGVTPAANPGATRVTSTPAQALATGDPLAYLRSLSQKE